MVDFDVSQIGTNNEKVGTFNTFQLKNITSNQIAFMNNPQYLVKSFKDTFYVQDTYVSLQGVDNRFNRIFCSKIVFIIILNILRNFQGFWAKI